MHSPFHIEEFCDSGQLMSTRSHPSMLSLPSHTLDTYPNTLTNRQATLALDIYLTDWLLQLAASA